MQVSAVTQAAASMESTRSRVTVQGLGMKAQHVKMTLMSVTSHLPVKITVLVTTAMAPTSVDVFRDLKEVIIFSAFSFFPFGLFSLSLWFLSSRSRGLDIQEDVDSNSRRLRRLD